MSNTILIILLVILFQLHHCCCQHHCHYPSHSIDILFDILLISQQDIPSVVLSNSICYIIMSMTQSCVIYIYHYGILFISILYGPPPHPPKYGISSSKQTLCPRYLPIISQQNLFSFVTDSQYSISNNQLHSFVIYRS